MAARPPDGATFEVSRLGRGRPRRPIAPIVWSGLLVGLISFAVLGRAASGPPGAAEGSASPAGVDIAGLSSLVPAPGDPVFRHAPLLRAGPPELDSTLSLHTSTGDSEGDPSQPVPRRLWITGDVFVRASLLVITIESPAGRVVDSKSVNVVDADGTIRPAESPRLRLSFALPAPLGDGRIWVNVSALDSTGRVVAELRREVAIGSATNSWQERSLNLMS